MAAHPPPSSSSRSRAGDKPIGVFYVEDEIGKGSFATVYRGRHKVTGALVAVKSVKLSNLNKKLKANLYTEIEILKGLHHPHIVALIDCHETSNHINLVMEYCELGDLSYLIKKRESLGNNPALKDMIRKYPCSTGVGGLNEVVVRHFLKQLASALEFLRDRAFIHRDIKPQNLLLLPSPQYLANTKNVPPVMTASKESLVPMVGLSSLPQLKLADFGFARSLPTTALAETLCGSPLYMAPEILRYEKYDAKADLWSVGAVLFEMMMGRPPFRAANHVELLRKIEMSEDQIRFYKDVSISPDLKDLIKLLLKRAPTVRLDFEPFFRHPVVTDPIPGLVGDDKPKEIVASRSEDSGPVVRRPSTNRRSAAATERDTKATGPAHSSSPRERVAPASPRQKLAEPVRQAGTPPRASALTGGSLPKRPAPVQSATAPNAEVVHGHPSRPTEPLRKASRQSLKEENARRRSLTADRETRENREAIAEAEQAVRDAREYVLVEKRAIEVNAFADEMAANPRLSGAQQQQQPQRAGTITRRATTQGAPASTTGAVPASPSRVVQVAQGRPRPDVPQRQNSYGPSMGSSPSTASALAKALNGASVRMFGVGFVPSLIGKGVSPPQLYNPFPAYPASQSPVALISDGRQTGMVDEDLKIVNTIEEAATRSDVVFGFAEVKYKQLIPLAPSMDHGLGGACAGTGDPADDEEGLTVEAIVALSEEALVLYVKALSLLAKSMDIAGAWWSRRSRGEVLASGQAPKSESPSSVAASNRINSAVQWVRNRFNEVLEKAEFVRSKLLQAQKQLPEDHPGHPNNYISSSKTGGASAEGIILSSGISAEKLMYDRAVEMSRSAAINEIANEDLQGCEISYVTAMRMLEAVLESDEEMAPQGRRSSNLKEESKPDGNDSVNGIGLDDRKDVLKVLSMIRSRLTALRRKMSLIAKHQSLPPSSPRPGSISHSGGTTPTTTNTPPK